MPTNVLIHHIDRFEQERVQIIDIAIACGRQRVASAHNGPFEVGLGQGGTVSGRGAGGGRLERLGAGLMVCRLGAVGRGGGALRAGRAGLVSWIIRTMVLFV